MEDSGAEALFVLASRGTHIAYHIASLGKALVSIRP